MAHGRKGPDLVMTSRYAGASEIRSVSEHEENRTPDGSSAIDPERTPFNRVLIGPRTQQAALKDLWESGVGKPAKQAEDPYVQMVLSASPEFFRRDGQGRGEWDQERLDRWIEATFKWLRKEYGRDLVHVSLHLDEDTPHLHALVVPTYEKKPRKPGRRNRNETEEEFEARKAAAESAETVRTAGRSSSPYWSRMWARREARQSYHRAVEHLGIGYGRDFVAESEPSPEHKPTGKWVREEAGRLGDEAAGLRARTAKLKAQYEELIRITPEVVAKANHQAREIEAAAVKRAASISAIVERREAEIAARHNDLFDRRASLDIRESKIEEQEHALSALWRRLRNVIDAAASIVGIEIFGKMHRDIVALEKSVVAMSAPEKPGENADRPSF